MAAEKEFEEKFMTVVATIEEIVESTIEKLLEEQLPTSNAYEQYDISYANLLIIMRMAAKFLSKFSETSETLAKNTEKFCEEVKQLITTIKKVPISNTQQ